MAKRIKKRPRLALLGAKLLPYFIKDWGCQINFYCDYDGPLTRHGHKPGVQGGKVAQGKNFIAGAVDLIGKTPILALCTPIYCTNI